MSPVGAVRNIALRGLHKFSGGCSQLLNMRVKGWIPKLRKSLVIAGVSLVVASMVMAANGSSLIANAILVFFYIAAILAVLAMIQGVVALVVFLAGWLVTGNLSEVLFKRVFWGLTPLSVIFVLFMLGIMFVGYIWSLGCGTAACY